MAKVALACLRTLQERLLRMLSLVVFIFAVYGLSNALTVLKTRVILQSTLGRVPIVGKMAYCPACVAFWLGLAASVWVLSPASLAGAQGWTARLLDACMACGVTYILHVLAERLGYGLEEL